MKKIIIKKKFTITMVITLVRMLITASSSGFDWIRSVTVNDKFPMFSILTPDDHLGDFSDLDDDFDDNIKDEHETRE